MGHQNIHLSEQHLFFSPLTPCFTELANCNAQLETAFDGDYINFLNKDIFFLLFWQKHDIKKQQIPVTLNPGLFHSGS